MKMSFELLWFSKFYGQLFQLATQQIQFSMYNSVLIENVKERWVHCLVTKAFSVFTWPTGVYKKSCFKQISVLMLGSLSRWLSIMVVAARRWDEKFYRFCPIFQLIWDQSISLENLLLLDCIQVCRRLWQPRRVTLQVHSGENSIFNHYFFIEIESNE